MKKANPLPNVAPRGTSPFHVPAILDFLGGLVQRWQSSFIGLGNLESSLLADQLRSVKIDRPIYICGLARSGSTLLHHIIAACAGVATHRVKDYPLVFTPSWWRRATRNLRAGPPHERPHRDRILITMDSPDALEEMLWMAFFPRCHDPEVSSVLDETVHHPAFETFYRNHLGKMLLAERATRYVAKANYHVARLAYLHRLFPDARFVIPIRAPAAHIASLMRQHAWFTRGQRGNARALAYMQRSGHFEFGRDRRPMNLGDNVWVSRIVDAWARGDEVRGWAHAWAMLYGYLDRLLASHAELRAATHVLRFEELCARPEAIVRTLLERCQLPQAREVSAAAAAGIAAPDFCDAGYSPEQVAAIAEVTAASAAAWGY